LRVKKGVNPPEPDVTEVDHAIELEIMIAMLSKAP
jgi:hypothetical protein